MPWAKSPVQFDQWGNAFVMLMLNGFIYFTHAMIPALFSRVNRTLPCSVPGITMILKRLSELGLFVIGHSLFVGHLEEYDRAILAEQSVSAPSAPGMMFHRVYKIMNAYTEVVHVTIFRPRMKCNSNIALRTPESCAAWIPKF